jgi:phosphohistidine swiveling domain-containing protein
MNSKARIIFFKRLFKKSWLTQGLNGVPLYLTTASSSGHRMKKYLGFDYSPYLFYYKNNYAEGSYDAADFPKLWRIIKRRMYGNFSYLIKIRGQYNKIFNVYEPWFKIIRSSNIKKFSDQQLLSWFIKAGHCLIESIDLSHVIEIVSIGLEADLKKHLEKKYSTTEVNKKMQTLANFYKPSFINQEEADLKSLAGLKGGILKRRLSQHASKYYWFRTNYTGSEIVDAKYLLYRLKQLIKQKAVTRSVNKYFFSSQDSHFGKYIKLIVEVADWQDQRKVNIFKAIYHTQIIINEIGRRLSIPIIDLQYLAAFELLKLKKLNDLKKLHTTLKERRRGCFDWISYEKEILVSGQEFKLLEKFYHSVRTRIDSTTLTIEGTVASSGRVIGWVRVCKSLRDISKIKSGDIMVTSMTRPEYLSAMKKAAAIVTDEGGITCHAAIVSRELGIPCIIGTKIATKALKSGDYVEVNANHGVVNILSNK